MKIKIVFLGNSTISKNALESLFNSVHFNIIAVVTSEDKLIGRSHSKKTPTSVAKFAEQNNIFTIKSNSINNDIKKLRDLGDFDILLTASFGQYLSDDVLNLPKFLSLNLHGSLLPEGRGGAPLHWAIIKGKTKTGVSIMKMESEMDSGDYFYQHEIPISTNETFDSLYKKMSAVFLEITATKIKEIYDKKFTPIKQDESKVSKWLNIKNEDSKINWNQSSLDVFNQIRGLYSKPGAWTLFNGIRIKVNSSAIPINKIHIDKIKNPGDIISIDEKGILVSLKNNESIYLTNITMPGKKPRDVNELLNGSLNKLKQL